MKLFQFEVFVNLYYSFPLFWIAAMQKKKKRKKKKKEKEKPKS